MLCAVDSTVFSLLCCFLFLQITAYNTVFNTTGTPDGFSFILAIDWFVDRLRTTVNVTGDAVVAGMVAHLCPIEGESSEVISSDEEDVVPQVAKSEETPPEEFGDDEF